MIAKTLWHFRCTGAVFGGLATELTGIVVEPQYQARSIGRQFTEAMVQLKQPELLTAYTRNPAILKMLGHIGTVFPSSNLSTLRDVALALPGACEIPDESTVYHFSRYGENGLYGIHDPALRVDSENVCFMDRYPQLADPSNALVVVTEVRQMI